MSGFSRISSLFTTKAVLRRDVPDLFVDDQLFFSVFSSLHGGAGFRLNIPGEDTSGTSRLTSADLPVLSIVGDWRSDGYAMAVAVLEIEILLDGLNSSYRRRRRFPQHPQRKALSPACCTLEMRIST